MKINQYLLNALKIDGNNFLNKDSVFKGKIVDVFGSKVLIEVKGKDIIPATLDSDVKVSIGDELNFLVKSSSENEILIKAIDKEELQGLSSSSKNNSDSSISKLLKNMNIRDNKISLDVVKNLIKGNVTLNKDNINNSIKILEKVLQLNSLVEDEKVIVLNEIKSDNVSKVLSISESEMRVDENDSNVQTNKSIPNSNFYNNKKTNIKVDNSKIDFKLDINEKDLDKIISLKSDIRNIVVVKENTDFDEKDITINIKDIFSENSNINLKQNLPKLITFLVKNNIKPTLNNIINMQELNQDPKLFIDKFDKLNIIVKRELGENIFKDLFIQDEALDQSSLDDVKSEILEIQEIISKVKSQGKFNIDKEIINLKNKNDFLTDINKNALFTLVPMENKKYNLNGLMNFVKKNNKKINKDKTNVFINLNTNSLGNIKISCNFVGNNIGIRMGMEKQHLSLFEKNEKILIQKVMSLGYKVQNIHYVLEEDIDIIDTINGNANLSPIYYLDVKV